MPSGLIAAQTEGGRLRQREELSWDAVPTEASATPWPFRVPGIGAREPLGGNDQLDLGFSGGKEVILS